MNDSENIDVSRRRVVLGGLGAAAAAVVAAWGGLSCGGDAAPAAQTVTTTSAASATSTPTTAAAPAATVAPATTLAPKPECKDADDTTPAQTEGPYFKASSPERANIRGTYGGTKLVLSGTVVGTDCKPVARALVDFWQADNAGAYDNSGFDFRGHQFTDAEGRYTLETVVPGLYPGRTRHIHVKVQPSGGRVLTTQLYFPGEPRNASDGIYRKECEVAIRDVADGRSATFQFVMSGKSE
jgi:protocatechuate 3,4-dioxygenase beta subunit